MNVATSDPTNSTPSAPADDTRERLLLAAEEVFAEAGYEAATTRDICRRAGVKNVGAINYHFRNKEHLYGEAVKFALATCARTVPFPDWPPGTPPERKLREFIRVMMQQMLETPRPTSMQTGHARVHPTDGRVPPRPSALASSRWPTACT